MRIAERIKNTVSILAVLAVFTFLPSMSGYAEGEAGDASVPVEEGTNDVGTDFSLGLASLALDPKPVTIDCDQSVLLTALVPNGVDAVWSSSDEKVATVGDNGDGSVTVMGVGGGTATITCSAGEQVRTFDVTVNPPETLQIKDVEYPSTLQISQGWSLGGGSITSVDDLKTITSTVKAENGELVGAPYTLALESGVKYYDVIGINDYVPFSQIQTEGTYTWILVAEDTRGRLVTLSLPIRAVAAEESVISVGPKVSAPMISVSDKSGKSDGVELWLSEKKSLAATVLRGKEIEGELIWMSYDPSIATVSPTGEITGVGTGSTTIVCKTWDNSISSGGYNVTVRDREITSLVDGRYAPGKSSMEKWVKNGPMSVVVDGDDVAVMDWQANPVLEWNAAVTPSIRYSELRGQEVTISLDVRSDDADLIDNTLRENGGGFLMDINIGSEPGIRQRWVLLEQISYPKLSTEWQHISATLTLTDDVFTLVDDPGFIIDDNSWVYITLTNRSVFRMQIKNLELTIGDGAVG